ncbi:hypothetical protein QUF76_08195 [Desulfobacterales bacterium HSG16]|nr:hypothetical protein [Desulfobacterales bacterium HSG16]
MAHLKARQLRIGHEEERKIWKLRLVRMLYEKGYEKQDILELFRFIDWLIELPDDFERDFWDTINQMEEDKKMPYVTSVERIGANRQARDSVLDAIDVRFQTIPGDIAESVRKIRKTEVLQSLHRHAITCENLDVFRCFLKNKDFLQFNKPVGKDKKAPYVSSAERIGVTRNARDMVLDLLNARFKTIPRDIAESLGKIEKNEVLKTLNRHAATCENLDMFRGYLKELV